MAIPKVLHPVKPQDFTMRPVTVHKRFVIRKSDLYSGSQALTGSGYKIWNAIFTNEALKLGTDRIYPTNSFDGTYQHVLWKSIDHQFYRHGHDSPFTLEHANARFSSKFLNYSASIVSVPYLDFGESIMPGKTEVTFSGIFLRDDKNGNLYDISLNSASFAPRNGLVAYWGFNDLFRKVKEIPWSIESTRYNFTSRTFSPDTPSEVRNVIIQPGVLLQNTASGISLGFASNSHIFTKHRPEFEFSKIDDFSVCFWVKYHNNSQPTSSVISKNTVTQPLVYGNLDKPNQNDITIPAFHTSMSTEYIPTAVVPYRFQIVSGSNTMQFIRSDGIHSTVLSGSGNINDSRWHHFAAIKTGSILRFYQDGVQTQSGSEVDYNAFNSYALLFGTDSLTGINQFSGSLDEIRIYNSGLSDASVQTLANSSSLSMYQTTVVGNVFYRSGHVVISSLAPSYNQLHSNDWTLRYTGTHTIYEWECLVRMRKSEFNLTMNPTYLKAPNTDLIRDDATGSLSEGGLYPYFHTIGLYNDAAELVAIGKVNQPIQVRDDVDLNISIKWHT